MRSLTHLSAPVLFALCAAGSAQAGDWQHTLTPYVWGSSMSGKTALGTALGPVEADVDLSFGDILKNLKIGGMVNYQGERDRLLVMADAIYMDIAAHKTITAGPAQIDARATVKQTALEADVGYRVSEQTHLFAGLRYNDISPDVKIATTGSGPGLTRIAGGSESWIDPVIGAMTVIPLAEHWSLGLRGDIGGFGIGSDFVFQVLATVRWQIRENIHVIGGYRYIDMDYKHGSGTSLFVYDMAMSGPGVGVAFSF